jgi:integrase
MTDCKAKKLILPTFRLTTVCDANDDGAIKRKITTSNKSVTYYYKLVQPPAFHLNQEETAYSYNFMPVVIDGHGALWKEANLYILDRIEGSMSRKMVTFSCIAGDLAGFKSFIEEDEIDFTSSPRKKQFRPTYRYRRHLQLLVQSRQISATSAARCMSSVINFYRWLIDEGIFSLENPLWAEGEAFLSFSRIYGQNVRKKVSTTNIAIKVSQTNDPYAGIINDGGKLHPLTEEEQVALVGALLEIGNTEMILIYLIGLCVGSRIQSTLTIQPVHVRQDFADNVEEIRIPAGLGTGIDTKNDKLITLVFPRWLYELLKTYSFSNRAEKRRKKAAHNSNIQPLFLSKFGTPFYESQKSLQQFNKSEVRHHFKNGQAVRQFMTEYLIPLMCKKLNREVHFRFHDLRASFGMNLTDKQLALVEKGTITLHQAREFVKARLGHEDSSTTDLYLNYRTGLKMIATAQTEYESHLVDLARRVREAIQ